MIAFFIGAVRSNVGHAKLRELYIDVSDDLELLLDTSSLIGIASDLNGANSSV